MDQKNVKWSKIPPAVFFLRKPTYVIKNVEEGHKLGVWHVGGLGHVAPL
jgi:hypothetical protein